MGLLDDAIREHLELKRLRGADPSEVARDERAALGSPDGDNAEEPGFAEFEDEPEGFDDDEPLGVDGAGQAERGVDRSTRADAPHSSEETMEVDMRTIIDADIGPDEAELELNGEAMAANAATPGGGASRTGSTWGVDPDSAGVEVRERRRWSTSRPVRALRLGGNPSVEGSLP